MAKSCLGKLFILSDSHGKIMHSLSVLLVHFFDIVAYAILFNIELLGRTIASNAKIDYEF